MAEFEFTLESTTGAARAARFDTPHGVVHSPAFMAVGTLASVKALDPDDLHAMDAQMILANAYHLHLRPGDERPPTSPFRRSRRMRGPRSQRSTSPEPTTPSLLCRKRSSWR